MNAYSLHIGLNAIDEDVYGTNGKLEGCENDARNLARSIAKSYTSELLLTKKATKEAVVNKIVSMADNLKSGDIFLLTYSGHGSQVPDEDGDDETDKKDETWCLYDGQMIDDELHGLLARFEKGVRIVIISDSCHSGTISKTMANMEIKQQTPRTPKSHIRLLPSSIAEACYKKTKNKLAVRGLDQKATILASVKTLSGCQDNQFSYEEDGQGRFTKRIMETWNDGKYKGNYYQFMKMIRKNMPDDQSPCYTEQGFKNNLAFDRQKPFEI